MVGKLGRSGGARPGSGRKLPPGQVGYSPQKSYTMFFCEHPETEEEAVAYMKFKKLKPEERRAFIVRFIDDYQSPMIMYWLVWEDEGGHTFAVSFDHEATNEDREKSHANGFNEIGPPIIKEGTESKAIRVALDFEYAGDI